MSAGPSENRPASRRRKLALVALLHFVTVSYFIQGGGYNQVARISEVRMLVERGHASLDEFADLTRDTSHVNGKVYSNKTPSLLFFVASVYEVVYQAARITKIDTHSDRYQQLATQVITFFSSGLFAILIGQLFFFLLGELFPALTENDRLFFAAMVPLSTMIFPYATFAMVNVFETFWVGLTLLAALRFLRGGTPKGAALLALAYGVAVLADPVLLLVSPGIAFIIIQNHERRVVILATFTVVFTACMLPWLLYNQLNFGDPFITNPQLQDAWLNQPGLLWGVFGMPKPVRIFQVLFWSNRSLFPTQSYPLLFLPGVWFLLREKTFPRATWCIFCAALFPYLLFICSWNIWSGGDGYGPRYFMPALLVLICWSVPVYQRWRKIYVTWVLITFVCMLIVTSTNPLFDFATEVQSPFWTLALPDFLHGRLSSDNHLAFPSHTLNWTAANLGWLLFGLRGLASLVPLFVIQLAITARLLRVCTLDVSSRFSRLSPKLLYAAAGAMALAIAPMAIAARSERRIEADRELDASVRLYQGGQFVESIAAAERALKLRPDWAAAHNNICAGYDAIKQWEAAAAACEAALALEPDNQLARNNLAWARQKH